MVEPDFMRQRLDPPPVVTLAVVVALYLFGLLFYYWIFGGWM